MNDPYPARFRSQEDRRRRVRPQSIGVAVDLLSIPDSLNRPGRRPLREPRSDIWFIEVGPSFPLAEGGLRAT